MIRVRSTYTPSIIFVVLLTGCNDGTSDSNISEGDGQVSNVLEDESPDGESTGIKMTLEDGSVIYLLVENNLPSDNLGIGIFNDPEADMSQTLGETFYEFESPNVRHIFGVLETDIMIASVTECDLQSMLCSEIPMAPLSEKSFSFDIIPEYKYAFDIVVVE